MIINGRGHPHAGGGGRVLALSYTWEAPPGPVATVGQSLVAGGSLCCRVAPQHQPLVLIVRGLHECVCACFCHEASVRWRGPCASDTCSSCLLVRVLGVAKDPLKLLFGLGLLLYGRDFAHLILFSQAFKVTGWAPKPQASNLAKSDLSARLKLSPAIRQSRLESPRSGGTTRALPLASTNTPCPPSTLCVPAWTPRQ